MSASAVVKKNGIPADSFRTVNSYYRSLGEIDLTGTKSPGLSSCFALRLARMLMEMIEEKNVSVTKDSSLPVTFYKQCLLTGQQSGLLDELGNDEELMIISLKQMAHILRRAGILVVKKGRAAVDDPEVSDRSLYFMILDSFWNMVSWEDIFPSNTEAASALFEDRMIIRDLLLRYGTRVEINRLANEFFELTGFAGRNDLVSISFLDFYLFFWLRNFHIINYYDVRNTISIELTQVGQKLLSALSN